ncbi:MAG: DUF58 domain-containing protein, partial [Planctomycetia bacterium]
RRFHRRRLVLGSRRSAAAAPPGFHRGSLGAAGLEFGDVRRLDPADDARMIDPRASSRFGEPYVKQFVAERLRTLWLLVDRSPTMQVGGWDDAGPASRTKEQAAAEAAALLAFAATAVGDRVGLWTFSTPAGSSTRANLPAAGGERTARRVVEALLDDGPIGGRPTAAAVERLVKPGSVLVVVGDFRDVGLCEDVRRWARRGTVYAVRVIHPVERSLPAMGLVRVEDAATGRRRVVDTSDEGYRKEYERRAAEEEDRLRREMRSAGAGWIELETARPTAPCLIRGFAAATRRLRSSGA